MAFDMYLDKERVFIDYDEEIIFNLINENDLYPKLNWLWQNYYESPVISASSSKILASELSALADYATKKSIGKFIIKTCNKLSAFFTKAYASGKQIKCLSD